MPHITREAPVRPVTRGPRFHYFGYYDKFPWDATGRYLVGWETDFMDRPPAPDDRAVVGLIDAEADCSWTPLAEIRAFNWQQGTMLQWLGTQPDRLVIYNDVEDDAFVARVRDVFTGDTRTLPRPIYAVSRQGDQAVTLNFARVHRTRPGYGYCALPDPTEGDLCPADDGIYWMDLETGENRLIISLAQIVEIRHQDSMDDAEHWFNHLQFNHDGSRFIFLHRWKTPGERGPWRTRMFTASPDGTDICCLSDHDMVSHFDWRDPQHVLAWARRFDRGEEKTDRYFLFTDQSDEIEVVGEGVLTCDGHCSYSPDGRWILTDTYPGQDHKRTLLLYRPEDDLRVDIGRFYSPPELQGEIRCDLHPRWSRDGKQVCFDSMHEGPRQMYVADVSDVTS